MGLSEMQATISDDSSRRASVYVSGKPSPSGQRFCWWVCRRCDQCEPALQLLIAREEYSKSSIMKWATRCHSGIEFKNKRLLFFKKRPLFLIFNKRFFFFLMNWLPGWQSVGRSHGRNIYVTIVTASWKTGLVLNIGFTVKTLNPSIIDWNIEKPSY